MNPDGSYDDLETEALLAEYEIDGHVALLAEIGMELAREPPSEPPELDRHRG